MGHMIKKTADILANILLVGLLLAASLALIGRAAPNLKLPLIGNYKVLVVHGGSMEPAIKVGSVIIIKSVDPAKVKVGDIISFNIPGDAGHRGENKKIATHRVFKTYRQKVYRDVTRTTFQMKGDANDDPDEERISAGSIIGKVIISIPYAGYLVRFAKTPLGLAVLILAPAIILISGELRKLLKGGKGQTPAPEAGEAN